MSRMIDALFPAAIPAGTTCDIAAAYIDHNANPQSFAQMVARFPGAVHVKISVQCTVGAHVLDVERGTYITAQQAITWVVHSRTAGIDPTVYCNQNDPILGLAALKAAFAAAGVPEPHWWVANYDGDPTIPAGCVAKQYTDLDPNGRNTYDTSSTIPGWPFTLENDMTPEQAQQLADLHSWLAGGTAAGQHNEGGTIAAILSTVQGLVNKTNLLLAQTKAGAGQVDVTALAAALEADLAKDVLGQLGTLLTAASKQ